MMIERARTIERPYVWQHIQRAVRSTPIRAQRALIIARVITSNTSMLPPSNADWMSKSCEPLSMYHVIVLRVYLSQARYDNRHIVIN